MQQQTLRSPCLIHGIGIHSGKETSISLLPAPANTGIVFRVFDGDKQVKFPLHPDYVTQTNLNTGLGCEGVEIGTVEHLLAALAGLEVDNIIILAHGSEIPAMDGSALPFVDRILEVGLQQQTAQRQYLKILSPIKIKDGDKSVELRPSASTVFSYEVEFPHPSVGVQSFRITVDSNTFVTELASARTFGFVEELEALHSRGRALGANLYNAVGLDADGKVVNEEGLRFPNELVRHKILDAIGDLMLAGRPILGEYRAIKSGHALNLRLVRALADYPERWKIVTGSEHFSAQAV